MSIYGLSKEEKKHRNIFNETIAENVHNLGKYVNTHVHKEHRIPKRHNLKRYLIYYSQTVKSTRQRVV
jgi:hypothetical protein